MNRRMATVWNLYCPASINIMHTMSRNATVQWNIFEVPMSISGNRVAYIPSANAMIAIGIPTPKIVNESVMSAVRNDIAP